MNNNFNFEYSEKELKLIKIMGFEDICHRIEPNSLYNLMATKCFLDNICDNSSKSIRNCLKALINSNIRRMTPEFDNLIEI